MGLLGIVYWLQCLPEWARTLSSMAVARVAAALDPGLLPPIGTAKLSARAPLAHVDKLFGV